MRKTIESKIEGITLIALVITIIVLLVLAGVTISTLTGENGLLKRTRDAQIASENAQKAENSILTDYENKILDNLQGRKFKCR